MNFSPFDPSTAYLHHSLHPNLDDQLRTTTHDNYLFQNHRYHYRSLISFAAAVQITVLCTILPAVHAWLAKVYSDPDTANLFLAKGSILFLVLGPIVTSFADKVAGVYIGKLSEIASTAVLIIWF